MDMSKWELVATQGMAYLVDTKEPNPDAEGDTMARIYDLDNHLVSPPISLGSLIKSGYWDPCNAEDVPKAPELLKGAKEVTDPSWSKLSGVVL